MDEIIARIIFSLIIAIQMKLANTVLNIKIFYTKEEKKKDALSKVMFFILYGLLIILVWVI